MDSYASFPDLVGYVGSAIIVALYFQNISGRIDAKGLLYPCANLAACVLIVFSLLHRFNPPSFVIEVFWSAVSLYGIVSYVMKRRVSRTPEPDSL